MRGFRHRPRLPQARPRRLAWADYRPAEPETWVRIPAGASHWGAAVVTTPTPSAKPACSCSHHARRSPFGLFLHFRQSWAFNKTERSRISIVSFYNLKAVRNSAKAAIAAQGRTEAKRSHSFTCSRQSLGNESGSQSRMAELIRAVPGNVTKAQMSKASSPVTRKARPRSEPPKTVTATADTSVGM